MRVHAFPYHTGFTRTRWYESSLCTYVVWCPKEYDVTEVTCKHCLRELAKRVGLKVDTPIGIISDRMKEVGNSGIKHPLPF